MIRSIILVALLYVITNASIHLTKKEIDIIDNYIDSTSIEETIGQLFVIGLPVDMMNYHGSSIVDKLIKEEKFGSVILNTYNYYTQASEDMRVNSMISFHNFLQDKAKSSSLGIPLLLMVDFETPKFSSIQKGLIEPIPPLVLASTQDKNILYNSGYLNGLQLSSIGINLVLGPTLDIYNVNQEASKSLLQNRAFAGNSVGVINTASHFLNGLKESNLSFIIKHIPGHGSVEANPHDNILPQYGGSTEQFKKDIKPFHEFINDADGIMTSHIVMPAFNNINNQLITFSKSFFKEYLPKEKFQNKLIITDDLSGMGAIHKYMKEYNRTISDITIEAFEAGHDLMLFCHVNKGKFTNIRTSKELIEVKNNLLKHIKETNSIDRFKSSLKKVLIQKAKIHKKHGEGVEKLFSTTSRKSSSWRVRQNFEEIQNEQQSLLLKKNIKSIQDFSYNAILSGATVIQNKDNIVKYINLEANSKIGIYCNDKYNQKFEKIVKNKTDEILFLQDKDYVKTKKNIINRIKETDLTIFLVDDINSRNILDYIRLKEPSLSNKIIVFTLSSPLILTNESVNKFHIVSLATEHNEVFNVIRYILTHDPKLKDIKNYPVRIGLNGVYHSLNTVEWVAKYTDLKDKKEEKKKNSLNKTVLDESVQYSYYLLGYIIFITFCIVIYLLISKGDEKFFDHLKKNENKSKIIFIPIIIVNLVVIFLIYDNSQELKNDPLIQESIKYAKKQLEKKLDDF